MGRIKLISIFTAIISLLLLLERVTMSFLYPENDNVACYVAPLYFGLFYSFMALILKNVPLKFMMLFKGAKMILTLTLMFVLAFFFKDDAKEILITFLVYYIVLLFPESILIANINR